MVSREEKQRRKEMAKAEMLRRESQAALKERLKAAKAEREAKEASRPLAGLAEAEKKMAKEREKAAEVEEAEEEKVNEERERAAEAEEAFYKRMMKGASGAGRFGVNAAAKVGGAAKKAASLKDELPNIFLFLILIVLGGLDVLAKNILGYIPAAVTILISFVLGIIFYWIVRRVKIYKILVVVAFIIDAFVVELPLAAFPDVGIREFLIGIRVFVWLIVAIILFVMEFLQYLEEGKTPPLIADLIILLLIGLAIFFTYPQLMNVYENQKTSHAEYFGLAQEQVAKVGEVFKAQVPAWKSAYYGIACTLSEPMAREQCVKQKEAEAKCAPYQKAGQLAEFEDCKNVELGIKTEATGAIDPAQKEPLKLTWEASQTLKQTEMRISGTPTFNAILKIENPRAADLNLEVECLFTDTTNKRNFSGLISPRDKLTVKDKIKEESLICTPTELLQNNTRYLIIFKVRLLDFTTESKLQMLFFGRAETELEKKEIQNTKSGYPLATGNSRAANDLARLNFNFFEGKQGYIAGAETIQLNTKIENIGKGQIIGVKRAEIDLVPNGLTSDDLLISQPCGLIGDANTLSFPPQLILYQQSQKEIFGEVCVLRLSDYLKGLGQPDKESFKAAEFKGYLTYSYEVRGEFSVPKIVQI